MNIEKGTDLKEAIEEGLEINKDLESNFAVMMVYAETDYENKDAEVLKSTLDKINKLEFNDEQKLEELNKKIG